jgi:4-hydroxy-3-polyprenylbenzoate decarboxylase
MAYRDLREWVQGVGELGQLQTIEGAHWDLEIGALTELICEHSPAPPAVIFDSIVGYPRGSKVLVNLLNTVERLALTTGLPTDLSAKGFIQEWRRRLGRLLPLEPKIISDGPILQHRVIGGGIDLTRFPVPRWHELDGGRYIGTAVLVITRDPEEGWVNVGTYRVMLQGIDEVSVYISPGKHGRLHREKAFAQKKPLPVAIVFGSDPLLFLAASTDVPYGMNEFAYASSIKGEAIELIEGPITGLPIPAAAEIAIEGELTPENRKPEGPFGEWTGYYASGTRGEPVMKVQSLLYREEPIICGAPPLRPSVGQGYYRALLTSALIWNALEEAGIPDVSAVWMHPAAGRFMTIVAIRQRYPGHAKQTLLAASACRAGAYMGRYVVVVDDDVDVYNTNDLIWAIATRSNPERDIDIVRRMWSGPLDPIIPKGEKGFNSRALIDATRPWEWKDDFPPVSGASPTLRAEVAAKWKTLINRLEQGGR